MSRGAWVTLVFVGIAVAFAAWWANGQSKPATEATPPPPGTDDGLSQRFQGAPPQPGELTETPNLGTPLRTFEPLPRTVVGEAA